MDLDITPIHVVKSHGRVKRRFTLRLMPPSRFANLTTQCPAHSTHTYTHVSCFMLAILLRTLHIIVRGGARASLGLDGSVSITALLSFVRDGRAHDRKASLLPLLNSTLCLLTTMAPLLDCVVHAVHPLVRCFGQTVVTSLLPAKKVWLIQNFAISETL